MRKKRVILLAVLALFPAVTQTTTAFAETTASNESTTTFTIPVNTFQTFSDSFASTNSLPKDKEDELSSLKKDAKLSKSDVTFLRNQYLQNHASNQFESSKLKVAAAKKALKVAIPIIKKYAKQAGLKLGEHELSEFINVFVGFEDNIQSKMEKSLRKMGFSKKMAGITARAIMFVLF